MGGTKRDPVRALALFFTLVTTASLVAMAGWLVVGALPVLRAAGLDFLTTDDWSYRRERFGAAAMLYGTGVVAAVALALAAPLAFLTAVFSSEICGARARQVVKLLVELLAGVPSVVYGLLGVLYLRVWIDRLFVAVGIDALSGDTLATAGVLLAVMILPTLATLADDALRSVPLAEREAARGLGLTRLETTMAVVVPRARAGLVGALLLATGRALGETTAVFLVVGRADGGLPRSLDEALRSLTDAGQTVTSKLGSSETHLAAGEPLHMAAMLGLGLALFASVLALTTVGDRLRQRPEDEP